MFIKIITKMCNGFMKLCLQHVKYYPSLHPWCNIFKIDWLNYWNVPLTK